jgi:hypothetical protein
MQTIAKSASFAPDWFMIPTSKVCLRIHPGHIPTTVLIKVSLIGEGAHNRFGLLYQDNLSLRLLPRRKLACDQIDHILLDDVDIKQMKSPVFRNRGAEF